MKNKNLLVNASAAKQTGAKAIVEKFCKEYDFSTFDRVYVFGPKNLIIENKDIKHIEIETKGLMTYLFSILFIYFFVVKYRAQTVLSFSNVNVIFPYIRKLTYFHQKLVFSQTSFFPLAPTLLKFTLKYFTFRNEFIVQNHEIKELLSGVMDESNEVRVSWPGYNESYEREEKDASIISLIYNIKSKGFKYIGVVPIYDLSKKYKNFDFIKNKSIFFTRNDVAIIVTSPYEKSSVNESIFYSDFLSREKLDDLYFLCDFMVFPSNEETLGLPIFEFAGTGKVVFVKKRPYLDGNPYISSEPKNIIFFNEENFELKFKQTIRSISELVEKKYNPFSSGDWEF